MNKDNELDEKTAAWLKRQFEEVEYSQPSPSNNEPEVQKDSRGKRLGFLVAAASFVTATFVASNMFVISPEPVWAAEPNSVSSQEVTQIRKACSDHISTGLGDLEYSGSASTSESENISADENLNMPPKSLPSTTVIDRRNNGALGIFEDDAWRIVCLVKFDGTSWINQALTAEQKSPESQPALSYGGQTAWISGESVSFLSGFLPDGKTCARFKIASGENASATCTNGRFAIWYPGSVQLDQTSLTYY